MADVWAVWREDTSQVGIAYRANLFLVLLALGRRGNATIDHLTRRGQGYEATGDKLRWLRNNGYAVMVVRTPAGKVYGLTDKGAALYVENSESHNGDTK